MAWCYSDCRRETGASHTPYMLGHSFYSAFTMDGNKRGVYDCKRWEELLGYGSHSTSTRQTQEWSNSYWSNQQTWNVQARSNAEEGMLCELAEQIRQINARSAADFAEIKQILTAERAEVKRTSIAARACKPTDGEDTPHASVESHASPIKKQAEGLPSDKGDCSKISNPTICPHDNECGVQSPASLTTVMPVDGRVVGCSEVFEPLLKRVREEYADSGIFAEDKGEIGDVIKMHRQLSMGASETSLGTTEIVLWEEVNKSSLFPCAPTEGVEGLCHNNRGVVEQKNRSQLNVVIDPGGMLNRPIDSGSTPNSLDFAEGGGDAEGMHMSDGIDDDEEGMVGNVQESDAYWLQREISQAHKLQIDPQQCQKLAEDMLKILAEGYNREVGTKLWVHLQIDKFSFIKYLLRNRLKIVWRIHLARNEDEHKRNKMEEEMVGLDLELSVMVEQLHAMTTAAKEIQKNLEKNIREETRRSKDETIGDEGRDMRGAAVWGGASTFNRLCCYAHPQVELIDFSPGERYLVTYSSQTPSNPRDPKRIVINIFDVRLGEVMRDFKGSADDFAVGGADGVTSISWPVFKWSGGRDDKYFARIGKCLISVYETETFSLIEFNWSPTDSNLALFVIELGGGNQPARVSLVHIPSKDELRQKNLVSLSDCKMYWQSNGDYLAVQVERYTKTTMSTYTGFELCRIKERGIPIEVLELENKNDKIIAFACEPKGHRFAVIQGDSPKLDVCFYTMKSSNSIGRVVKLTTLRGKQANALFWSPAGHMIIHAGLENFNGQLEFYKVDDLETMATAEQFVATNIEWDPTGRYVATSVISDHRMENGFNKWSFHGKLLYKVRNLRQTFFLSKVRGTQDDIFLEDKEI